jgi:hypothetical protein
VTSGHAGGAAPPRAKFSRSLAEVARLRPQWFEGTAQMQYGGIVPGYPATRRSYQDGVCLGTDSSQKFARELVQSWPQKSGATPANTAKRHSTTLFSQPRHRHFAPSAQSQRRKCQGGLFPAALAVIPAQSPLNS